jgi:hypothetical protein
MMSQTKFESTIQRRIEPIRKSQSTGQRQIEPIRKAESTSQRQIEPDFGLAQTHPGLSYRASGGLLAGEPGRRAGRPVHYALYESGGVL